METAVESIRQKQARLRSERCAVSNGNKMLPASDGRLIWVRRFKDLVEDHTACYGGADYMSVPRMALLRRQCASLVECELIEAHMAERKATNVDLDRHIRTVNLIKRCYEALGLDRAPRTVSQSLRDHIYDASDAEDAG